MDTKVSTTSNQTPIVDPKKEKRTLLITDIARDVVRNTKEHASAFATRVKENKAKYAARAAGFGAALGGVAYLVHKVKGQPEESDYVTYDAADDEESIEPEENSDGYEGDES